MSVNKKYYYAHEIAYQMLIGKGKISWDGSESQEEYSDFSYKDFLIKYLDKYFPQVISKKRSFRALEVGCGTGPGSCYLCEKGFSVKGIDIVSEAIDIARDQANLRDFDIDFEVSDICNFNDNQLYDLIVDGHLLHCIVFDEDRKKVLENIRKRLNSEGVFLLETLALGSSIPSLGDEFKFDDEYILWHKVNDLNFYEAIQRDDGIYFPQRRILPHLKIRQELQKAGFNVIEANFIDGVDGKPATYEIVCKKK